MDEFVNWDQAEPTACTGAEATVTSTSQSRDPLLDDLDLALANVTGDEFSFWALEHFENNILPTMAAADDITMQTVSDKSTWRFEDHLEQFEVPCTNCLLGGYDCKRIPEGQYKGHCTSCVALRCACSYGNSSDLPANPWPLMGDHPRAIQQEDADPEPPKSTSAPDLVGLTSASTPGGENQAANPASKPKVGARFSRESVKILKNWLSTHSKHPYPTEEEKEMLQKQTGLTKTQITNWLANTRRRNKNALAQRSTSPGIRSWATAIEIPKRPGTPALEHMNPLQRWQHSPPEHEPASVTAIARAVRASASSLSSGLESPYSQPFTDDGSGRSLCASTISSAHTSRSSTSAYSFGSRGSFGSHSSWQRGRRRRRRKAPTAGKPSNGPPKTFQCTFCTESFRTKHDWQRHENSLHLSLERWVCCPNGPKAVHPENRRECCVFCGHPDPDEDHMETHNYSTCQERTTAERTFYRKDHLRQHLKLVHNAKFVNWSMDQWKHTIPEIRSRCGFCNMILDTWSQRVDHLAEHFKKGKDMAEWKGGWGFDAPVLEMVENSIPPYLIHYERSSPDPFEASRPSTASARHAFELLKTELTMFIEDWREREGSMPSDDDIQRMACAIIYKSEESSEPTVSPPSAWLRDLLFSNESLAEQAKWTRLGVDSRSRKLRINGKGNIFELDPMEMELQEFVKARRLLGLSVTDAELQSEACNIITRMDEQGQDSNHEAAQFLIRLVSSSTTWLSGFRRRAQLPEPKDAGLSQQDPSASGSEVDNQTRLENELSKFVQEQRSLGIEPTDIDLQRQARIIMYEYDDGCTPTSADDPTWLALFKQRNFLSTISEVPQLPSTQTFGSMEPCFTNTATWARQIPGHSSTYMPFNGTSSTFGQVESILNSNGMASRPTSPSRTYGRYYLSDANCYGRLARELKKWVVATMSPNNPNRHVPTDEELQYQARWIIYEDDDPWNQTAADNAEWLRRFKRDAGIIEDTPLPGLPQGLEGPIEQGGTGFMPPYLFPSPYKSNPNQAADADTASSFVSCGEHPPGTYFPIPNPPIPPPQIFCSRELESALIDFVTAEVLAGREFPSDDAIRVRAREVLGRESTPADDEVLMAKFKEMMRDRLGFGLGESDQRHGNESRGVGKDAGGTSRQVAQMGTVALHDSGTQSGHNTTSGQEGMAAGLGGGGTGNGGGRYDNMLQNTRSMDFEFGDVNMFFAGDMDMGSK